MLDMDQIDIEQVTQFISPSGKSFVYLAALPYSGKLLYSPDGNNFYVLALRGLKGTADEHRYSFTDVHRMMSAKRFWRVGDIVHYDGEQYARQEDVTFDTSSRIVPLPDIRCGLYLCGADSTLVYLSGHRYLSSTKHLKLFVGDGTVMRQVPIQEATYSDDYDRVIITTEGTFTFLDLAASNYSWSSKGLLDNLNLQDYNVAETSEGEVTLTKK